MQALTITNDDMPLVASVSFVGSGLSFPDKLRYRWTVKIGDVIDTGEDLEIFPFDGCAIDAEALSTLLTFLSAWTEQSDMADTFPNLTAAKVFLSGDELTIMARDIAPVD